VKRLVRRVPVVPRKIYIRYVPPIPLQGGVARSARVVIGRNNGIWNHPTLRGTPPRRGMGNDVPNNHYLPYTTKCFGSPFSSYSGSTLPWMSGSR